MKVMIALCALITLGCGDEDWVESPNYGFRVRLSDWYPRHMMPDLNQLDRATEIVVHEYVANRHGLRASKLLAQIRASAVEVVLEPEVFRWDDGHLYAGLFTPPRSIRAVWHVRACIADGGIPHELLHLILWLRGDKNYGLNHDEAGVWGFAYDTVEEKAFVRIVQELCPSDSI